VLLLDEKNCPECGVQPGMMHLPGCDIERCPLCGLQAVSCDCTVKVGNTLLPWTGEYPGVAECREYGFYAKLVPGSGWVSCESGDLGATEDLNRLYSEAEWDPTKMRFTRKINS
jgi:hypothetical protein